MGPNGVDIATVLAYVSDDPYVVAWRQQLLAAWTHGLAAVEADLRRPDAVMTHPAVLELPVRTGGVVESVVGKSRSVALYWLFGADKTLLYVGISWRPEFRFTQYARSKAWWPEVIAHEIEWHGNRNLAEKAETLAIASQSPCYNIQKVQIGGADGMPIEVAILEIAAEMRDAIYADDYLPGERLPSRAKLGARYGLSAQAGTTVYEMLAAEGLVSPEQGRGTFVLGRRRFRARVTVGRAEGVAAATALAALGAAAEAEPAASSLETGDEPGSRLAVSVAIEAGGLQQAVSVAMALVENALKPQGGWDLAGASVTAGPAEA